MDAFIYALVLVPALTELLPQIRHRGHPGQHRVLRQHPAGAVPARLGPVDGVGPDRRSHRARARADADDPLLLALHVPLRPGEQHLAARRPPRVRAASGIGGEQPVGGTFVAEEWPESQRKMGAGLMHTGYYFGFFLAAVANYFIGANYGWRWMFILGGMPALLVGFIQSGVHESTKWQERFGDRTHAARPEMRDAFARALHAGRTRAGRSSCRGCSSCRSSGCGRARSTCRRR